MLSIRLVLCNPIVLWMTLHHIGSGSLMRALYCGHVEVAKMLFIEARVDVTSFIVVLGISLLNALL